MTSIVDTAALLDALLPATAPKELRGFFYRRVYSDGSWSSEFLQPHYDAFRALMAERLAALHQEAESSRRERATALNA